MVPHWQRWGAVIVSVYGQARPAAQAAAPRPQLAEEAFKNVRILKGIPVKEFMGTMGFFSRVARVQLHRLSWRRERERLGELRDRHAAEEQGAPDDDDGERDQRRQLRRTAVRHLLHVPSRQPAAEGHSEPRRAVRRAAARRSRRNRSGAWACVRPRRRIRFSTSTSRRSAARRRLARLTSFTAKGTYEGFDSDFAKVPVDVYAKAPNLRAMVVHMAGGDDHVNL